MSPRKTARQIAVSRMVLVGTILAVTAAVLVPGRPAAYGATTSGNLVRDPAFRHGASAWATRAAGALSVTGRGYQGHRAVRLKNVTGQPRTLALNDRANTVAHTVRGAVYRASVWIRTDAPGITTAVRLIEYKGRTERGRQRTSAWLRTRNWTRVVTLIKAESQGGSIDFNVVAWKLPAARSIYVSQPRLVRMTFPSVLREPRGVPTTHPTTHPTSPPAPTPTGTSSDPSTPAPSPSDPSSPPISTPPTTAPTTPPPSTPPTSTPPTSTPTPAPDGYRLVFADDFGSLDRTKWTVRNNTWAGNEMSIDTSRPANVFVSDGALTLRAIQESYTVGSTTRQYTSGYLDSIGHGAWQYGRFEMRAKLPQAQGMWPAFWLRDNNGGLGEIDAMEAVGGLPTRSVQTVHQSTNGDMAKAGHEDVLPSGTTADWHTYAVDREPGSLEWFIDGRLVFSKTVADLGWLDTTFNQPMNIRLNLQVGGSMPNYYGKPVVGAPAGASDFVIDYVRIYQRSS